MFGALTRTTGSAVCLGSASVAAASATTASLTSAVCTHARRAYSDDAAAAAAGAHLKAAMQSTGGFPPSANFGNKAEGLTPNKISSVGVVGGGLMGTGIATSLVLTGHTVVIKEVNQAAADKARDTVSANMSGRVKSGRMEESAYEAAMGLLTVSDDYEAMAGVDMAIEAVIEKVDLKQKVFAEIQAAVSDTAILATNTSTIDINVAAGSVEDQSRVVGTHYFSPAHIMPLLEVVVSDKTAPQVAADVLGLARASRKVPVFAGNCAGFVVNRMFAPYGQTAGHLVDAGISPYDIDAALFAFGMPMGCFQMGDMAGQDVCLNAQRVLVDAYPERSHDSPLLHAMVAAGRLGQKSGSGYYVYAGRKGSPDPEGLAAMLAGSRAKAGLPPFATAPSDQDLVDMTLLPVVNEGCRIMAEGHAASFADLDVASCTGYGFPQARGGIMHWAEQAYGAAGVCDKLEALADRGAIFAPSEALRAIVAEGGKLSD